MAYPTELWYDPAEVSVRYGRAPSMLAPEGGPNWRDRVQSIPDPYFQAIGGRNMADMMSLDDLMSGAASAEGVNKRAKLMRSMQAQAQALRRVGFEPMEIDLLLRGRNGMLRPNEEEAFAAVMRKLALIGRAQAVPGLTKNLRAYPPAGGSPDTSGVDALRGLGFGGGGMQSLDELMR